MITYEFQNLSKDTLGFRLYEKYTWRAGATLVLKIADASSVGLKFELRTLKKQVSNLRDLNGLALKLSRLIASEFPEGSVGFDISFIEPVARPEVTVKLPTTYMEIGDEMKFEVETKNLEGKVLAYIKEKDIALILKDGRTIRAVGPGMCNLRVGTKEFNKEFPIKVGVPDSEDVEKVEVPSDAPEALK
jgi:hypothetical protein